MGGSSSAVRGEKRLRLQRRRAKGSALQYGKYNGDDTATFLGYDFTAVSREARVRGTLGEHRAWTGAGGLTGPRRWARYVLATATALFLSWLLPSGAAAQSVDKAGYYSAPYLVLEPGAHGAMINDADVDPSGRFFVTGSDDKTVRVWSGASGRLVRTINVPAGPGDVGKVYAVAISPDGATIAAGGYTGTYSGQEIIYLFDRVSGRLLHRFEGLPSAVHCLTFSRDGKRLAGTLGKDGGVWVYDPISYVTIGKDTDYGDSSYGASFAPDGRLVTASYDGSIRLYDGELHLLAKVPAKQGKQPFRVEFSPDGGAIAVGYENALSVDVLDGHDLSTRFSASPRGADDGSTAIVGWSADGSRLFTGGRARDTSGRNAVFIWNGRSGDSLGQVAVADDSITAILSLSDGRMIVASAEPRITMLGRGEGTSWIIPPPIRDYRVASLLLDRDGKMARIEPFHAEQALRFDLEKRILTNRPGADPELAPAQTGGLSIAGWENGLAPTLAGKPISLEHYETSRSLAVAPDGGGFLLGAEWSLRRFGADGAPRWSVPIPGVAWAVNQSGDGRLAVAALGDGTIRWYRMTDGAELLALFLDPDGERWVEWTPQGQYAASPGGEDLIRWVVNRGPDSAPDEYPVGAFRERFYRPDVIAQVLDTLDIDRAVQLADAARTVRSAPVASDVVEREAPPIVTIIDPWEGAYVGKPHVNIAYQVRGQPGDVIKRLRVLVNGLEVASTKMSLGADGKFDGDLEVPIAALNPRLTLIAENASGVSAPATVQLTGGVQPDIDKPTLYVLAVGISKYRLEPRLNLNFADADASDFVVRMERQKGGLYRDVIVRPLINTDATTKNIRDGLFWLMRQMSSGDVGVIFISSHGHTDGPGELYIISSDTNATDDISIESTAVGWHDIQKAIDALASRGKTLVFVDACKSGQVLQGARGLPPDIDRAVNELRDGGSDITVFSSSTGTELSREAPSLGHGYFTYALLEALDGKGVRSGAYLTAGDLNRHLRSRVKELTNGSQTPRVTNPTIANTNPPLFVLP